MFRWGEQVRALYPVYDWIAGRLGGRRRLAALLLTILNLLIVIGPATVAHSRADR